MQADIANVETADWVAGGAALLLFIALFLPWTHVKIGGGISGFSVSGNAGASFGWISILSVLAVEAVLVLTIFDVDNSGPVGSGLPRKRGPGAAADDSCDAVQAYWRKRSGHK